MKNIILRNVFSNWAGFFVNIVISFFLAPFIVHELGNVNYGIWVIMMQFTGYLYLLDFGVRESIIKYVSGHKVSGNTEELNEIISSGLLLYTGIGAICLIITGILAWFFPDIFNVDDGNVEVAQFVVIVSGFTIAQTLVFNVYGGILMGLQRYDIFNKIGIIFALVRVALIVVLLNMGYGLITLALIQLAIGLANNIIIYFYSRSLLVEHNIPFRFTRTSMRERLPILKKLYNYSIYVLINNLGQKIIFSTDAILIGIFMSASSVTFYAIAGSLIEYLRRLILISNSVLNPVASELESKNEMGKVNNVLIQGARFSILIALPISITYLTMGREFIGIWMGKEFSEASGDVLAILTVTTLLAIPHNTISNILYGISKHKIIANLRIIEAVANLCLSLILIQYMGITGVALGTAIPQLLLMVIVLPILVSRKLELSLSRYAFQVYALPFLSSIPFVMLSYYVNQHYPTDSLAIFFLQVLAILPVYLISVITICLSKEEKLIIWGIFKKLIRRKSVTNI